MKRKFYLILALVLALTVTGGLYTYTTATATIDVEALADIVTVEPAPAEDQPKWELVLPTLGAVGTEILRPNAAGFWTLIKDQYPDTGEQHWEDVDDEPVDEPDDWDTYVYTSIGTYMTDLYNIEDHIEGSGTINGVTVYFRFSGDELDGQPITAYARAVVRTNNRRYVGSEQTQTGKTFVSGTRWYEWTTNPDTGSAWTWGEIDALQAGISLRRAQEGGAAYCTQVYVAVDYEVPPVISGDVPEGDLFMVKPHLAYPGDLLVKVYLTNTGALIKAYQYLNMELYLEGSVEAGETPNYRLLSLDNGVATFNLKAPHELTHTISVEGGAYGLISDDPPEEYITPEFYCEVTQR